MSYRPEINPRLDLVLERLVDVPVELVWRAWTSPEHLKQWFTPKPWQTVECQIDLRPGGIFRTVMRSPEGEEFPGDGCFLEVVPDRRLVWTSALGPGFRPTAVTPSPNHECGELMFTAYILMEPAGAGRTKYTAIAMHADEAGANRHASMGFKDGWGAALDQLVEVMKRG